MPFFLLLLAFFSIVVLAGIAIVLSQNELIRAFVGVLAVFLGVSGLMVLAMADFNAIVQIMVYVGGVLVLLLFGFMLSNRAENQTGIPVAKFNRLMTGVVLAVFFGLVCYLFLGHNFTETAPYFQASLAEKAASSIGGIGKTLLSKYAMPFELSGILLLAAFIYAATIIQAKKS